MPQLRAGATDTPLWSFIPAKTGGLSWLGECQSAGLRDRESSGHHLAGWWPRILLPLTLGLLGY